MTDAMPKVGVQGAARREPDFFGFPPAQEGAYLCASVYFETGRAELSWKERQTLDKAADAIVLMAAWKREVACSCIGYADTRGTYQYNVSLSTQRALAVQNHLVTRVSGVRFDIASLGMSTLFAHSDRSHYLDDRRVDVKITTPLLRHGIGFEFDNSAHAGVFVADLERAEVEHGGTVLAWMEGDLQAIKDEHTIGARYGWKRATQVTSVINRMSMAEFIKLSRQHAAACARVSSKVLPDGRHSVTIRISDTLTTRLLVPELTVEGSSHSALSKDLYVKLCAGMANINQRVMSR